MHLLLGHLLRFAVPIGIASLWPNSPSGWRAPRTLDPGGGRRWHFLSLTLFPTVSFHSSPYYTGADIVFFFAWVPLLLAGSGGVLSLDGVIAARVAAEKKSGPSTVVPIRFELVQQVCGNYEADMCACTAADSPATSEAARFWSTSRPHCGAGPRTRSTAQTPSGGAGNGAAGVRAKLE